MPYNAGLTELNWARESTPGTDLAATSKMLVNVANFIARSENYRPPVEGRGLIQRNRGFETVVKRWTEWNVEGPANYEQLQNWLSGAVVNVASPTGAGPYVWAHTRNPAAIPTLATFTFERRESDGSSPVDHAWHYGMVQKFGLRFADGQPLLFTASGFARRRQTETRTASLSLPTPEIPASPLGKVYIDTSWGGLGGTQVTSQVLSGSIQWSTGAYPIWTEDGRTDLDFTLHGIDRDQVMMEIELNCLLGAQYDTERAAAEANTLRALRIQFDGTSSRQLQVDVLAKYEIPELFDFGIENGQKIVQLKLVESTDGTNLTKFNLTNNVSAYA